MAEETPTPVPYLPDYASYNWTGGPANSDLMTNTLGGDSRTSSFSRAVFFARSLSFSWHFARNLDVG